jgi:AcrR family transcriptional regulator
MPKIVDANQYRQKLLNKCFDLFANQGYANVTTRQIAKELGVSTGTLYHYFPNKQALFEQLVEQISLQDVGILRQVNKDLSVTQRIKALGLILIEHQEYIIKQAAIWDNFYQQQSNQDVDNNSIFRQADALYQQAISDLLDLEDLELAKFIWTLVDGIAIANIGSTDSSSGSSFAIQIQLLTQMLIAYFEKHQGN